MAAMRRLLFGSLGCIECLVAATLFGFAWMLPGATQVNDHVGRVETVTKQSGSQIAHLRDQVRQLRSRQPQLKALAERLQKQSDDMIANVRDQNVDYDTVQTISDALGDVADGLDGFSQTLDPKGMQQLGLGLGTTADFLDKQIAPGADHAADDLEKSTAALRTDADRLAKLLRTAPLDLTTARDVHESLGKFADGLQRMKTTLKPDNIETMREGFKGLETSLSTGADQVERLAGLNYPVVTFSGFRAHVEHRAFWPEGETIAEGMRKAAKGAGAAVKEMDLLAEDLPKLRDGIDESRRLVDKTREALAAALKDQQTVEPLLKDVPEHAARLAEELPRLGTDLAKILRDTSRLKEVAAMLREAQKAIDNAVARWPDLRKTLSRSAVLLRATQQQLNRALENRDMFEVSLELTIMLVRALTTALPALADQLDANLQEQEQSLASLENSINDVGNSLPEVQSTATTVLSMTRLLMVLIGGVFALHGAFVLAGARAGPLRIV
jgi:uncharacterized phage infection (PIP) family protein YhgE